MSEALNNSDSRVVGTKQVIRAIEAGKAKKVFIAEDTEPLLKNKLYNSCKAAGIETEAVSSMRHLGKLCGISVGSAAAAIIDN